MITLEQVTRVVTSAIETDEEIDAYQFDRIVAKFILRGVVPLVCDDLRREILEAHHSCGTWDDETSNVRECTHLEDAQIVSNYMKRISG